MLNRTAANVVELSVREGISAQDLHLAIDRILDAGGCPTCGLAGIDLRFRAENNPQIRATLTDKLQDLSDVLDVNVLRGTGGMADG